MQNNLHTTIPYHCGGNVAVKSRNEIELTCDCCGKKFKRSAWLHKANQKRGRTKTFCSTKCAGKVHRKKAVVKTESERIKAARDSFMGTLSQLR